MKVYYFKLGDAVIYDEVMHIDNVIGDNTVTNEKEGEEDGNNMQA